MCRVLHHTMKKQLSILLALFSLTGILAQPLRAEDAKPKEEAKPEAAAVKEVAVLETSAGEITIEFWTDVAPETVKNFIKLSKEGFYDGTAFHRIMKDFMIQGGDPKSKDAALESQWGTGDPGYKIKAEFNDRKHVKGVISMARSANPDSAGCQFFICLAPAPFLDRQYTGFGKVIKGEDVLVKLGETEVKMSPGGEPSKPVKRIELKSVKIVPAEAK